MNEIQSLRLPPVEEEPEVTLDEAEPEIETEVQEAKPKKIRKTRTSEELMEAPLKGMSNTEKNKHLKDLREYTAEVNLTNIQLKHNCEAAYEKLRNQEKAFTEYKNRARGIMQFTRNAVSTCHSSILLAGNAEDK